MINDHVVSLELAKELKELGCPQKSCFCWVMMGGEWCLRPREDVPIEFLEHCSAYLASELGEFLPEEVTKGSLTYELTFCKGKDGYGCLYDYHSHDDYEPDIYERLGDWKEGTSGWDTNEANARAKMLIYLIKQGLVTFKKSGKGERNG